MKTILFTSVTLLSLFLSSCGTTKTVTPPRPQPVREASIYDCEHNGTLTNEERRDSTIFGRASKVQIVAFSTQVVRALPIDKNAIAYKYTKETVTLTEAQIDGLTDIFYNYNYSDTLSGWGYRHGSCYFPRHAVVLLDSLDKLIGYFEVCLECENHQSFPRGENFGDFCFTKYDLIEAYFKSVGVTFFKEEEEEEW